MALGIGQYSECSSTAASTLSFIQVLFYWRASVWKKIAMEILVWSLLYLLFTLIYRLALNPGQQKLFEMACLWAHKYSELLPVSFMLGFYVTLILSRWYRMWTGVGFVDSITLSVGVHLKGETEMAITLRRQIVRYILCFQILVYRFISTVVKKKFPTLQSMVDAGYIEPEELQYFADNKFWMPIKWSMGLINNARRDGLITNDFAVQQLFEYLTSYRRTVILLWLTDWVPVPLCYTQVIWLCVRVYFLSHVIGRQFLNPAHSTTISPVDIYVPILELLQFIFYIGWSKVAESLVNPWGEDDDDFDTNFIIGRNLKVGMDNVTNLKKKDPSYDLEDFLKMPRPEDVIAQKNIIEVPRNSGHGSIFEDDGFTRRAPITKPRAPTVVVMVKRSEVTKVEPSVECPRADNIRRRRGYTVGVVDLTRTTEYGIDEETGLKTPLGDVHFRDHPPHAYMHQHSCPSNMNTLREKRMLSTLIEADEISMLEHDDENATLNTRGENITHGGPLHLITPSGQDSDSKEGSSDRSTEYARSSPDGGSSGSHSGVVVLRIDHDKNDTQMQRRTKKQQ